MELVESAFRKIVPIVQAFKAGNYSHQFNSETRVTCIGKAEEPSFLHTHIVGRGDPEFEYVAGVKLDGPVPGLNFDMMGETANQPGNDKKVAWKGEEMATVVHALKIEVEKLKDEYDQADKLVVVTK